MTSTSGNAEDSEPSNFGYDVKVCDATNFDRHKCPLCDRLLREPVQTERGEIACERCYKRANKDDGICPIDNEPSNGLIYRDKAKEKDVLALICLCAFTNFGCLWKGPVRDIEKHERSCEFRSDNCQFCAEEMQLSDLEIHANHCPKLLSQGCPFIGCHYISSGSAEKLDKHLQENIILHSHLQMKSQEELQKRITLLESANQTLQLERDMKENEVIVLRKQITDMVRSSQQTVKHQQQQEQQISSLQCQLNELIQQIHTDTKSRTSSTDNTSISALSNEVALLNKQISEVDLRQQLFENTTFEGRLWWKIDNIASRMRQAVSGRVTALHSAPGFTHRHGHKFCGRLYLNGDGLGRNSHLSLFFVIMKSEYDSRLAWPFKSPVKFRLINQQDEGADVVEIFNPDPKSSSYRKPVKDMNVASGCPRFIEINSFLNGGFVKDDCVFIEIEVER